MELIPCPECGCAIAREIFVCPVCNHLLGRPDRVRDGGRMARVAGHYDREALAGRADSPPWLLAELARDPSPLVRRKVATNPEAPPEVTAVFAEEHPAWVAANPSLPKETMDEFMNIPDDSINAQILSEKRTYPLRLRRTHIIGDAAAPALPSAALEVRRELAKNPALPTELFARLAQDSDGEVRQNIAANARTPEHLLETLADDGDAAVVEALTRNPALPASLAERLAADTRWHVRAALAASPHLPHPPLPDLFMREEDSKVIAAACANPLAPEALLEAFSTHAEGPVRVAVAGNPATPPATLLMLASDEDGAIRWQVCMNPRSPLEALRLLSEDADGWIAHYARKALQTRDLCQEDAGKQWR